MSARICLASVFGVVERDAVGIGQDGHRALAVGAVDLARPARLGHFGQAAQFDQARPWANRRSACSSVCGLPRNCLSARSQMSYCSVPSVKREIGCPPTSTLSVLAIVSTGMRQVAGAIAVDRHLHLRLAQRERGVDVDQSRALCAAASSTRRNTRPAFRDRARRARAERCGCPGPRPGSPKRRSPRSAGRDSPCRILRARSITSNCV